MADLGSLRKRLGLTQSELAKRSGLRQATISALENGRSRPHTGTVKALAEALELDETEVLAACAELKDGSGNLGSDAIGQMEKMPGDWPFLKGLDKDLRSGLAQTLVAEWTHSSTALEGNTITLGDTLFVLTEGLTVSGKSLREHQELHGHAQALGLMMTWTRSRKPIRIEQLHELHRAVQTGTVVDSLAPVGRWKVEPNGTMALTTKGTSEWHDYCQPRHVPALIEAWLKLLSQTCRHPALKRGNSIEDPQSHHTLVGLYTDVHLGFASVHPYADGNGRLARLLANIPMLRAGMPPLLVPASERREYLTLLGDYTLARGPVQPGEDLVPVGKEREALRSFFAKQWEVTMKFVREFHRRQRQRER